MIVLYVFIGIAAVIAILLFLPVNVNLRYQSSGDGLKGEAEFEVYYWFFKIYSSEKNIKKYKNVKTQPKAEEPSVKTDCRQNASKENTSQKQEVNYAKQKSFPTKNASKQKNKETDNFSEIGDFKKIKELIKILWKPVTGIFGKIKIKSVYIHCVVGGEDAAKVAMNYGYYCIAIHSLAEWISVKMKTSSKNINIEADWERKKTYFYIDIKLRLRLGAAFMKLVGIVAELIKKKNKITINYHHIERKKKYV